jgi:lipoprotein-anchoring transpeptidase ErfK/SrfK
MESRRVDRQGFGLGSGRFWRVAILAATGTLGLSSQTEAAIYYWQDSAPAAEAAPASQSGRHANTQRRSDKKSAIAEKKEARPQGPLIISVSIAQQRLRIYDANGLFAESPVSTGMPGHSTPMGVFSVIQKQKFHQSNIYSGAPMPFMQRITWSGIALHAGVLPGHPASHGCIRMPMAFAVKMYGWTRMGARVIVTPGEVTPASFSHSVLATVKLVPQPVAAQETKADAAPLQTPAKSEANATDTAIELRSTVGHASDMKAASEASKLKTADASDTMPAMLSTTGISDAPRSALTQTGAAASDKSETSKQGASKIIAEADASKPEANPAAAKNGNTASSEAKPANDGSIAAQSAKAPEAKTSDAKPADAGTAQPAAPGTAASAKPDDSKLSDSKPADTAAAPVDSAKAATTAPTAPIAPTETPLKGDLKSDSAKAYLYPPLKKNEQIAVFVSRKDSKLYVRQNFAPLFDVPVTIAADERPLGTHIFTAQVDKGDANVLHWSVVSLPAPAKAVSRRTEEARAPHGRKIARPAPIEAKAGPLPNSPAEALDRLNLPAEVMAKIYEAVSTGGSIIVSDQGIAAGETGEGTDFIVSLR